MPKRTKKTNEWIKKDKQLFEKLNISQNKDRDNEEYKIKMEEMLQKIISEEKIENSWNENIVVE